MGMSVTNRNVLANMGRIKDKGWGCQLTADNCTGFGVDRGYVSTALSAVGMQSRCSPTEPHTHENEANESRGP